MAGHQARYDGVSAVPRVLPSGRSHAARPDARVRQRGQVQGPMPQRLHSTKIGRLLEIGGQVPSRPLAAACNSIVRASSAKRVRASGITKQGDETQILVTFRMDEVNILDIGDGIALVIGDTSTRHSSGEGNWESWLNMSGARVARHGLVLRRPALLQVWQRRMFGVQV